MTLGLEWDDAELIFSCKDCGYGPIDGAGCPNCRPARTEPPLDLVDDFACPVCGGDVVDLVCKRCGWDEYGGNIFVTSWSQRQAKRAAS